MPDTDALLSMLEWIAGVLTTSYGITDVLHGLAEDSALVLGITGAGVMLLQQGRYMYATSSLTAIAALERVVEAEQIGPCIDAGNNRQRVAVRDVCAESFPAQFPAYVDQAQSSDIRSVAAVPMVAGELTLGALGLYHQEPRDWSDADLRVAAILANIASGLVVHATQAADQRRVSEQLQHALDSRVVIEQAKGVVAVERGISVDEAFAFLRKQARDSNRRLHDVCAQAVGQHKG